VKYDNPTKAHWRKWAWNRIAEAASPGWRVMYLAGEAGLDHEEAERRGLIGIGVDCVQGNVDGVRSRGGVATCDQLHRMIVELQPDAVICDSLGGITQRSLVDPLVASVGSCVKHFVWNGLRGRDNPIKGIEGNFTFELVKGRLRRAKIGKHRGKHAAMVLLSHLASIVSGKAHGAIEMSHQELQWLLSSPAHKIFCSAIRPSYNSYQSKDSKGLYYDSVSLSLNRMIKLDSPAMRLKPSRATKTARMKAAAAKAVITKKRTK